MASVSEPPQLSGPVTLRLLEPFLIILATTTDTTHFARISDTILKRLLHQSLLPPLQDGEEAPIGAWLAHARRGSIHPHASRRCIDGTEERNGPATDGRACVAPAAVTDDPNEFLTLDGLPERVFQVASNP